jgi:predicted RNA-binding protein
MCESTVYTTDNEKIMEDVISIKIDGDTIDMADILNSKKQVKGKIVEIDLDAHKIYIKIR